MDDTWRILPRFLRSPWQLCCTVNPGNERGESRRISASLCKHVTSGSPSWRQPGSLPRMVSLFWPYLPWSLRHLPSEPSDINWAVFNQLKKNNKNCLTVSVSSNSILPVDSHMAWIRTWALSRPALLVLVTKKGTTALSGEAGTSQEALHLNRTKVPSRFLTG